MTGTNSSALLNVGSDIAWSPDGRRIAFVSATPGPEAGTADGDPMVIERYLYKPTASEGNTHFNDNQRLHLFVIDLGSKQITQLTDGVYYEHSIDWSPGGDELLFVSNREPKPDEFFNYDLFALKVSDRSTRRLTASEGVEYRARWSPDGRSIAFQSTRRGLTDLETTMEDTHVSVMNADGIESARSGKRRRQSAGPAGVGGGQQRRLFHRAGARNRVAVSRAGVRREAVGRHRRTRHSGCRQPNDRQSPRIRLYQPQRPRRSCTCATARAAAR